MENTFIDLFTPRNLLVDMVHFYQTELGFSIKTRSASLAILHGPTPQTPSLRVHARDGGLQVGTTGLVFHVTHFEAALSELTATGHVVLGSCNPEQRSFMIADPAGNQIEFREMSLN
ncbi:hypothetical protein [Aliiroseovarius sediminis]|uniref:hypothetical protein n=1 Tax=Aliiroseovarius sediminis TaxID=2925839 RepID=UPI001F55FEEB|nr:hypothetical protein [Aliiroseovarius sediminis]MCI2395973.1 hypothetical protein [Aliiroseovarius sediminis]